MSIGRLSRVHHALKAVRTELRNALDEALRGELTPGERALLERRIDNLDELKHGLARDLYAIRERLKRGEAA